MAFQLSRIAFANVQQALALGGQAVKTLAALDDRHAQFLFELPDPAGQRCCVMPHSFAALVKCFSRASATRYCSWRMSMVGYTEA